jgi:hemolysin III
MTTTSHPISRFSRSEEHANAISHFAGALLAIAGLVLMVVRAARHGDGREVVAVSIFGATMVILYFSSAMTHYLKQGPYKNFFFSVDKIAIYLLIAGTYTPFSLITLQGALGWVIFGLEWGCAVVGIIFILRRPVIYEKGVNSITVITYAVMGWLILFAFVPVIRELPLMGWMYILIGGACYTIGIFFYKKGTFRYHHLVWHLLVIAGTFFHFLSVFGYVLIY